MMSIRPLQPMAAAMPAFESSLSLGEFGVRNSRWPAAALAV